MPDELENIPPPETASLDPDLLRRAAEFMSEARQVQRESGRTLSGNSYLSEGTQVEANRTRAHSGLLAELARSPEVSVPRNVQQLTFERFEEMCRRRKFHIPQELRAIVYRLLALELVVNCSVLEAIR